MNAAWGTVKGENDSVGIPEMTDFSSEAGILSGTPDGGPPLFRDL